MGKARSQLLAAWQESLPAGAAALLLEGRALQHLYNDRAPCRELSARAVLLMPF